MGEVAPAVNASAQLREKLLVRWFDPGDDILCCPLLYPFVADWMGERAHARVSQVCARVCVNARNIRRHCQFCNAFIRC